MRRQGDYQAAERMPKREAGCGTPKDEKKPGQVSESLEGTGQEASGRAKACGKRCVNACVEERKSFAATARRLATAPAKMFGPVLVAHHHSCAL